LWLQGCTYKITIGAVDDIKKPPEKGFPGAINMFF